MKHQVMAATLLVALGASCAWAGEVLKKPVDTADTPEKLQTVIDSIHGEMAQDKRYEFINPTERRDVDADFAKMMSLLSKSGSVSAMKEGDRVALFNAQEHANGILTHSDRNRLVCERHNKMGSNLPVNECSTVADIERNRNNSQKFMQDRSADRNKTAAEYDFTKFNTRAGGH
jgi:hypothetical protein